MDNACIQYSYKHACLVTLTVDGNGQPSHDVREWQLPAYDPRNETKYLYRLHTLDIYFWAKEDALLFINAARRILSSKQLTFLDEPQVPPTYLDDRSPVVEKLENVAISDPSYQNGQNRDTRQTASSEEKPADYTPLAYNPASPAAPEAIRYREKTPPPPEDGNAKPLAAAVMSDEGQPFVPAYRNTLAGPSTPSFGPTPGGYFPGSPRAATLPLVQNLAQQVGSTPTHSQYQSLVASQSEYQASVQSPVFSGPPKVEGADPRSFSNYQYTPSQPAQPAVDYSIHHQIYRPTEGEAAVKFKGYREPKGRLEERVYLAEKIVTSSLKKLEKKYG